MSRKLVSENHVLNRSLLSFPCTDSSCRTLVAPDLPAPQKNRQDLRVYPLSKTSCKPRSPYSQTADRLNVQVCRSAKGHAVANGTGSRTADRRALGQLRQSGAEWGCQLLLCDAIKAEAEGADFQSHGSSSQGGALEVFGTILSYHASLQVCRYLRLLSEVC